MSAPQVQPAAWEDWCEACDRRVPCAELVCSGCGMDTSTVEIALWGSDWAAVAVMAKGVQCEAMLICLLDHSGRTIVTFDGCSYRAAHGLAMNGVRERLAESALERAGLGGAS